MKEIRAWATSDGQIFTDRLQAREHELERTLILLLNSPDAVHLVLTNAEQVHLALEEFFSLEQKQKGQLDDLPDETGNLHRLG